MNKNKLRYVNILFTLCVAVLVFVSMITLSPRYCCGSTVQRNGGEWKHKRMHTFNMDTWPCDRKSLENTQTEKWAHNRTSGLTTLVSCWMTVCAWGALETALSFSSVPLCSLEVGSLPSKQSQVATIITSSSFFSFKEEMHYSWYLRIVSQTFPSAASEWTSELKIALSLSFSALRLHKRAAGWAIGGGGGHFRSKRLRASVWSTTTTSGCGRGQDTNTHTRTLHNAGNLSMYT